MKRKILKISVIIFIILVIASVCFGFSSRTTNFNGTMLEDGIKSNVTITVKHRQMDPLFEQMHGNVTIRTETNETLFEFPFDGRVYVFPDRDICSTSTMFYSAVRDRMDSADLYFDKEFENIALIYHGDSSVNDPRREFYCADDAFKVLVSEMTNFPDPA